MYWRMRHLPHSHQDRFLLHLLCVSNTFQTSRTQIVDITSTIEAAPELLDEIPEDLIEVSEDSSENVVLLELQKVIKITGYNITEHLDEDEVEDESLQDSKSIILTKAG